MQSENTEGTPPAQTGGILLLWKKVRGNSLDGTASRYLKQFLDGRCLRKRGGIRS